MASRWSRVGGMSPYALALLREFNASMVSMFTPAGLDERMIDVLHVVVLFERVHHLQHLGGLRLRKFQRSGADEFVRRGYGVDAAFLERLLHVAETGEQATSHQLRFALVARAFAEFLQTVVDEVQLEVVRFDAVGFQAEHAHLAEL